MTNGDVSKIKATLVQKESEVEVLQGDKRQQVEAIEAYKNKEREIKSELEEIKKNNVTKSTLKSTRHVIWDKIQKIIYVEWCHLVLSQE